MKPRSPHLVARGDRGGKTGGGLVRTVVALRPGAFENIAIRARQAGVSFAEVTRRLIDDGLAAEDDHK